MHKQAWRFGDGLGTYQKRGCLEKRTYSSICRMEHPSKADSYRCFEQFKSMNHKKVFKKGFIGIAKSLGMCLLDGGYAVLKIDIKMHSILQNELYAEKRIVPLLWGVRFERVSVTGWVRVRDVGTCKAWRLRFAGFCHDSTMLKQAWHCIRCSRISPPIGCTFREGFGDGLDASRERFGDGFGTSLRRGCLEKRIFPLLWGVRFGCISVTGRVRVRSVGAPAVGNRRYYAWVRFGSVSVMGL